MAEQQQDVDTLKRRGRRRLVGAVALVLLAVIVLPMVFDPEPRKSVPPVSVRIPGEHDSSFTPKVSPRPADKEVEEKKPEEKKLEEKKAAVDDKRPAAQEKKPVEATPEAKRPDASAERARAEAALAGGEFIIPIGAFANPAPVVAKLAEAKIKHYTEKVPTSKGTVTRIRAGPFASKAEAEKALETLKRLGLKPGQVSAKSG